jgi:hypothetical protein
MMSQTKLQNPKFPEKIYSGLSVEDFIRQTRDLNEAQIQTLRRLRSEGHLY